jgi:hypothetical protein
MRTSLTTENRRVFCQLTGKDIGQYWAFRGNEHILCADWGNDRTLAAHGLASLALTPSPVEMTGQVPPLHEQGLKLVDRPVDLLRDDDAFATYQERTELIRAGMWSIANPLEIYDPTSGTFTIFPHQVVSFGGTYEGDWRLKWTQGFGPFSWKCGGTQFRTLGHDNDEIVFDEFPTLTIPLSGTVEFLVSGGEHGGEVDLEDMHSGYTIRPTLPPEGPEGKILSLPVPATVSYRQLRLTALSSGVVFYGIRTREAQPWNPNVRFDWNTLPPV